MTMMHTNNVMPVFLLTQEHKHQIAPFVLLNGRHEDIALAQTMITTRRLFKPYSPDPHDHFPYCV
jgi:hypothetical protein